MKKYLKKTQIKILILIAFGLQSCDYGLGLFIRNYEQEPVGIQVKYFYKIEPHTFDSIKYAESIIPSGDLDIDLLNKSFAVEQIDSVSFHLKLPGKSTVYFEPVYFGPNIYYLIVNQSDTLWLSDKNEKMFEILKEKGLYEHRSIFTWSKLIFNIKMKEIKEVIKSQNL
ncbi:MAG TPA: hypothetical protein PKY56_08980 [Candidatus Kapabacteria bacterium]|nr:hypothetical protein [Candidatus Kapabacteria bacterium]HPO62344.1 hypothetical protein [Candidatus Kapabacteria bacterium]